MKKKILIIASNYYSNITNNLIVGAKKRLLNKDYKLVIKFVPGTFEIPLAVIKNIKKVDACIVLGCVIKGETPHFHYICRSTFDAIMQISLKFKKPIGNGIITSLNKSCMLGKRFH